MAFVDAAAAGDEVGTRALLTAGSRTSLDLPRLSAAARAVAGGHVVLSQTVEGPWAIAAIVKGPQVFAAPLRHVNGAWRVELGRTISLRPILPYPGRVSPSPDPQIAAEARASRDVRLALWLDGSDFPVDAGGPRPGFITAFGRVGTDLSPGRHVVVAFARSGRQAAATAWTFRVGQPVG